MKVYLVVAQPKYEEAMDFGVAANRRAAARLMREFRDKYRNSFRTYLDSPRLSFDTIIRCEELDVATE